jgi:hypothetical protein
LPADRRHPLRFTLWTLVAIWATAVVATVATYLVVTASAEGHYHHRDYDQPARCTSTPSRRSLIAIHGFTPLSAGETAMVTPLEGARAPTVIYVWADNRCIREWELSGGR